MKFVNEIYKPILEKVLSNKYEFTKLPYRTIPESTAYRTVLTYRTHAYSKSTI